MYRVNVALFYKFVVLLKKSLKKGVNVMAQEMLTCKGCEVRIEKAVSEKTKNEYTRLVLIIGNKSYVIFDNNTISKILIDNLLKK